MFFARNLGFLKGTKEPSGVCRRVGARRHFGNLYKRHGNGIRDLQERSVFRSFRKEMQIRKNPELFSPFSTFLGPTIAHFRPFGGPTTFYPSRERNFPVCTFSGTLRQFNS